MTSKTSYNKRQYINVRIGLGGDVFRIDKRDIPFVKRLLSIFQKNGIVDVYEEKKDIMDNDSMNDKTVNK